MGYVPDSILADILEDDRVPMKASSLSDLMASELDYLMNLPVAVYELLAQMLGGLSGSELQADVLEAGHTAAAYVHDKVIKPALRYPWKLLQGDVQQNLQELSTMPSAAVEELDDTTSKIHRLLGLGYSRPELLAGLKLMGEVHWSTAVVEQGHASATL